MSAGPSSDERAAGARPRPSLRGGRARKLAATAFLVFGAGVGAECDYRDVEYDEPLGACIYVPNTSVPTRLETELYFGQTRSCLLEERDRQCTVEIVGDADVLKLRGHLYRREENFCELEKAVDLRVLCDVVDVPAGEYVIDYDRDKSKVALPPRAGQRTCVGSIPED